MGPCGRLHDSNQASPSNIPSNPSILSAQVGARAGRARAVSPSDAEPYSHQLSVGQHRQLGSWCRKPWQDKKSVRTPQLLRSFSTKSWSIIPPSCARTHPITTKHECKKNDGVYSRPPKIPIMLGWPLKHIEKY